MATKRNLPTTKANRLEGRTDELDVDRSKKVASWAALDPSVVVSTILTGYGKQQFEDIDFGKLVDELGRHLTAIADGDMSGVEAMLYAQATALQSIFMNMAIRAQAQTHAPLMQTYLTLALKAQSHSRLALEALAEVKNPRQSTFVKQQNIAQQQQVNNDVAFARAHEENRDKSNKLIKEVEHAALDRGRTAKTSGAHPKVKALEALNGANDTRRKEARKS